MSTTIAEFGSVVREFRARRFPVERDIDVIITDQYQRRDVIRAIQALWSRLSGRLLSATFIGYHNALTE